MTAEPDPWTLDASRWPELEDDEERLRFLLRYAILAPSGHNTQPWLFRIEGGTVELRADRSRSLPVADPDDRELTIGCGAALHTLRAAARGHGARLEVALLPDPEVPDLLARAELEEGAPPTDDERAVRDAILRRRTDRGPYEARPLEPALLEALGRAAREEGAWLQLLEGASREAAADLVAEGQRRLMSDPRFRRELAEWMRSNRSDRGDGIPGWAFGFGYLMSLIGPFVVRHFDVGEGQAAEAREQALAAPALAVLGTDDDGPHAWMRAGTALARLLLRATAEGVSASYLNQPVQVPALRGELGALTGRPGYTQLVMRLGYGSQERPAPRRPVEAVLE